MDIEFLTKKPFYLNTEQLKWVQDSFDSLSLREKAGQLFCILADLYSEAEMEKLVQDDNVGGILMRPLPMEELLHRYRKYDQLSKIPLIKAANLEEGGNGAIAEGTRMGCQLQIAAANNVKWAKRLGEVCGREAELVGINMTFSPDADIDFNFRNPITNTRTFGSDPETVKNMTQAYMEAIQKQGIAACAKHFPGDGVDYRDQHLHTTINALTPDVWDRTYGKVYRNLIDKGIMGIMISHIKQPSYSKKINPTLTDEQVLPASLSKELMTSLLRDRLGFNGLNVIDATIMGGFCQSCSRYEALNLCIESGGDLLVFNTDFRQDRDYLLLGLKKGILSQARFDKAVLRVLGTKAALKLPVKQEHQTCKALPIKEWVNTLAKQSITLVKNKENIFPLNPHRQNTIRIIFVGNNEMVSSDLKITELVQKEFEKRGFKVEQYDVTKESLATTRKISKKRIDLYLANFETRSDQTTVRVNWTGKYVLDLPRFVYEVPSIFVSLANPYHLQDVPEIRTYINAYTANEETLKALVSKLCGEDSFTGINPVDPTCGLLDTQL